MKEIISKLQSECHLPEEGLNILKKAVSLTPFQKNCVWTYCYPKNIGDYELPNLIKEERGSHQEGFMKPNENELLLLLRAYSCRQYEGYMKHLLWAFTRNHDSIRVPSLGDEELTCGICGKKLYPYNEWTELCKKSPAYGEEQRKEHLAFASELSSQCMCLNCQIQMMALWDLIKEMGIEQ